MPRQLRKRKKTNRAKSLKEIQAEQNRKEKGGYWIKVIGEFKDYDKWVPYDKTNKRKGRS